MPASVGAGMRSVTIHVDYGGNDHHGYAGRRRVCLRVRLPAELRRGHGVSESDELMPLKQLLRVIKVVKGVPVKNRLLAVRQNL